MRSGQTRIFDQVLVAVDFSPTGERLHGQLPRLRALGCRRLTLVHVVASVYGRVPDVSHRDHYQQRLDTLAGSLREDGFEVETEVTIGPIVTELLRVARDCQASAILAGSHGHSTLRDLFLGSTALDLIRHATFPVLLAPIDQSVILPTAGVCRPLLATDGSTAVAAAEAAFMSLLKGCRRGVVVSVGQWNERPELEAERELITAHIQHLEQQAPDPGFDTVLLGEGRPSEEIERVAAEREADLIIVGKRGRNPIEDLLLGSTAEAVCRHARRLVLLVPASSS